MIENVGSHELEEGIVIVVTNEQHSQSSSNEQRSQAELHFNLCKPIPPSSLQQPLQDPISLKLAKIHRGWQTKAPLGQTVEALNSLPKRCLLSVEERQAMIPTCILQSDRDAVMCKERGNATEECRALKREIEELLRRGYLKQFVSELDNHSSDIHKKESPRKKTPQRTNIELENDGRTIIFTSEDTTEVLYPHDNELVVTLNVGNCTITWILVDNGSLTDIIFSNTLDKMGISPSAIQPTKATLVGYDRNESLAKGRIILPVTAKSMTQMTEMMVVDAPSAYNMILGRPWLHTMKAVPSTYH
ncbi:hypothetical protein FNV43_RR24615 [Rhamnella rubrinervis]|uniref:Uncharacterized protein n=1 Tax=Rhamnella rubrinervis TaxID=2594499 RepID=A0A8K0GQV6_9ROSA|nr:hypothetical protein FNV43_RR24615 [Rhamnella rubrinervis]